MKAVFLRNLDGFTGHASLYKLDEEIVYCEDWKEQGKFARHTRYVVVSATDVMDGPETYIFPADEDGNVLSWQEMTGSYRGGLDHAEALRRMGATIRYPIHNLIEALPRGVRLEHCTITTLAELAAKHDVVVQVTGRSIPDSLTVVVLPGYYATDGNAEIEYRAAKSAKEAAREYVAGGDWVDRNKTFRMDVIAYRKALVVGKDGDIVEIRIDEQRHTIDLDPKEPPCMHNEHDWRERNVRGHGGGLIITEICAHCGCYRIHNTRAQRSDTGEQRLGAIEYRDAD